MELLGAWVVLAWLRKRTAISPGGRENAAVPQRYLSPKYVFSVVALAVFLVGMLLVRPQPISVSVKGTLRHIVKSADNRPLTETEILVNPRDQFFEPAWLDRLWLQVTKQQSEQKHPAKDTTAVATDGNLTEGPKDWSSQLVIDVCPVEGKAGESLIHVQLLCGPREYAVEFVDAMLHDFQAQHNQPQTTRDIVQRRDQLLAAQDFWQNQLVASRNDLEKFIADEFSRREAASKVFVEEFERNRLSQDAASEAATELTLESEPHRPTESSLALAPPIEPMVSPAMPKVSPAMPVGAPALPMVEVLNPEWNARAIQLQAATVRREELLRQVTEEHPSAVEATMAVQHLKADLASTPRTIPVTQPIDLAQTNTSTRAVLVDAPAPALKANQTPPASSSEENTIEQTAAPTSPAPPAPFDAERVRNEIEALATVKDLRNAIANAEERLAKQKLDLEALPPIEQSAVESVEIVSPAKVVEHVARMPSRARLSIVLAIACGIGAFAMHCCPKPGTLETFQRVEEVIESARLPLRGPLPTTDGPAIPQDLAIRWPKLAGTFVNVSEWTILATVALLLVSISIDSSQSRTLASDPLRAILTAVHRFSSNP